MENAVLNSYEASSCTMYSRLDIKDLPLLVNTFALINAQKMEAALKEALQSDDFAWYLLKTEKARILLALLDSKAPFK